MSTEGVAGLHRRQGRADPAVARRGPSRRSDPKTAAVAFRLLQSDTIFYLLLHTFVFVFVQMDENDLYDDISAAAGPPGGEIDPRRIARLEVVSGMWFLIRGRRFA